MVHMVVFSWEHKTIVGDRTRTTVIEFPNSNLIKYLVFSRDYQNTLNYNLVHNYLNTLIT